MRAVAENYKGIEYVRISSLPEAQKGIFWQTFDKNKIIKILKSGSLLSDCIQYHDYTDWLSKNFKQEQELTSSKPSIAIPQQVLRVA
jgi:hypothetical protein